MTDASLWGWSGVLLPHQISLPWPRSYAGLSINWLELRAVLNSLVHFRDVLAGRSVRLWCDNTTAVACIQRQGTLRSESLRLLTREVLLFCQSNSIVPVPKHLSGCLNVLADSGSRDCPTQTEWSLDVDTFRWLVDRFGPFQVDLFATRYNNQLSAFVSPFPDPQAVEVNAFSISWDRWDTIYLFPPVPTLRRVVPLLRQFRGRGVLVAPYYPPSDWFATLKERSPNPISLPPHSLLQVTRAGRVLHRRPSVYALHAWPL